MKIFLKHIAASIAILIVVSTTPCLANQPLDTNQLKLFTFIGSLAAQSEKGNLEAKFLLSLAQYSISDDKSTLINAIPANALQAYLLASLHAANKDSAQFAYWLDQSKSLLEHRKLDTTLSPSRYQNYDTQRLGLKMLSYMGDVASAVEKGDPEAETIYKILNASFDKNYSALSEIQPSTATEAFLVSSVLLNDNKPEGYHFLDKARELINAQTSIQPVSPKLPPIKLPPIPTLSAPAPTISGIDQAQLEEEQPPKADDESTETSNTSIPEMELTRIEALSSESELSEDDKLLFDACRSYLGKGLPKNYSLAATNFTKLANKGNAFAQAVLGNMYHEGEGVPQNYYLAAEWYEKSIQNGSKFAYNNMGILHARGLGVPVNDSKAEQYYKKAIALDFDAKEAYTNLGLLYFKQQKYAQAEPLFAKASHMGIKDADFYLAQNYDAQKKYQLSFPLWKKAALRGKPLGLYNLAVSYANGDGTARSLVKAYYCAGMAQKKGYASAQALKSKIRSHLNSAQVKNLDSLIQRNTTPSPEYI